MRFESGGKYFCIRREFDKSSKKVQLICEDDGEELSVEHGDLEMLLGGVTAASYDNTVSIGQLKTETDRTLADELRDFATNYYAGGGDDMNLTGAFGQQMCIRDRLYMNMDQLQKQHKNCLSRNRMQVVLYIL